MPENDDMAQENLTRPDAFVDAAEAMGLDVTDSIWGFIAVHRETGRRVPWETVREMWTQVQADLCAV